MAIQFSTQRKKRAPGAGRPKLAKPKAVLNIRVDPDVLERWKGSGKGWQTRLHQAIKDAAP